MIGLRSAEQGYQSEQTGERQSLFRPPGIAGVDALEKRGEPRSLGFPLGELAAGRPAVPLVPAVRSERPLAAGAYDAARKRAHASRGADRVVG
jgi:hypothetical protein